MPWNPEKYNQFKNIRYQPFFDLMGMISGEGLESAVDLGCGTGEQTSILAHKFNEAKFLGIDPSPEMLSKSKQYVKDNLSFRNSTVEDFVVANNDQKWDLVFSNAALQWVDKHEVLFPKLIGLLSALGQLAIQMPVQQENLLNKLLLELVREKPFVDYLNGFIRIPPLLSIDEYAQILFENGLSNLQILQKVYPITGDKPDVFFDFIAGTSLVPYMERMTSEQQEEFTTEYKLRIKKAFRRYPAIYAFKRLLLYGRK